MSDISTASGVEKATLYHYFRSKEELFYKVIKPPTQTITAALEKIVETDLPPVEKLQRAIRAHLKLVSDSPQIWALMEEDIHSFSGEIGEEIVQLEANYEHLWDRIIAAGMKSGYFRTDLKPRIMCFAILGMCNWMFTWYNKEGALSSSQIADQLFALVVDGIKADGRM